MRLTGKTEFAAVYNDGSSWSNSFIVLRALPNSLGSNRYGFAAGKRLGGAVVRNRVRRRLREAVRHTTINQGWDMVFIARQAAVKTDYETLKKAMEELLARARLLENEEGTA